MEAAGAAGHQRAISPAIEDFCARPGWFSRPAPVPSLPLARFTGEDLWEKKKGPGFHVAKDNSR